jgi:RNA polymerase sigma-70 factor (TIGR02943 family)
MPAVSVTEVRVEIPESLDPKKWVDRYADFLFKYAFRRINDQNLAKDLVQETFLAGLKGLSGFNGRSSERTWLTAILKHKIIDFYRTKSSGLTNIRAVDDEMVIQNDFFVEANGHWKKEYAPKDIGSEQDLLQDKEFKMVLQECIKKLPALWASVFTMKHLDEEKTDEILTALRLSQANFWVIIHRTKLSLRACLQKNWL